MKNYLLILLFFSSFISFACKCENEKTIKDEFEFVDYVVVGKILSIDTIRLIDSNQIRNPIDNRVIRELPRPFIDVAHFKLEIIKNYKGKTTSKIIDIYSEPNNKYCGYLFKKGATYIVYGFLNSTMYFDDSGDYSPPKGLNKIWVTACGRTKLKSEKELKILDTI